MNVVSSLKNALLAISKPSTLFRRDTATGFLLGNRLTTPLLVSVELALIWFFRIRPVCDFPWWMHPFVFLALAPILVVSHAYVLQPEASRNWRAEFFRREFFVFILLFPLMATWGSWMKALQGVASHV